MFLLFDFANANDDDDGDDDGDDDDDIGRWMVQKSSRRNASGCLRNKK